MKLEEGYHVYGRGLSIWLAGNHESDIGLVLNDMAYYGILDETKTARK